MWRSWEEGRGEDGLREKSGQRVERGDREEKREPRDVINVSVSNHILTSWLVEDEHWYVPALHSESL